MKHTNMKLFGLTFHLLFLTCATASLADAAKKLDIVLEGVSDEGRVISVSQRAE